MKTSVKDNAIVKSIDIAEDVLILASRGDNQIVGIDFDGKVAFKLNIKG